MIDNVKEVSEKNRLSTFEKAMSKMIGTSDKSYRRYSSSGDPVTQDFYSLELIKETLAYGEPV